MWLSWQAKVHVAFMVRPSGQCKPKHSVVFTVGPSTGKAKAQCDLHGRASKTSQGTGGLTVGPSWQSILGPYVGTHCSLECDEEAGEGRPPSYRVFMAGADHSNFF